MKDKLKALKEFAFEWLVIGDFWFWYGAGWLLGLTWGFVAGTLLWSVFLAIYHHLPIRPLF